jgi:NodT family efflux transporter outer membrane factor (OMF) lipoprotein
MKLRTHFFCGVILAGAFVGGCNLAPSYHTPDSDSSSAFKEAVRADIKPDGGWKLADPEDERLRGAWWELYRDSELNRLEEKVAASNQSVVSAEAKYREARALVISAREALLPVVSVAPSVIRSRSSGVETGRTTSAATTTTGTSTDSTSSSGVVTTSGSSQPVTRTVYTLPVEASYEVDLWGRIRNTIAQNAYTAQAAAADWANVLLSAQTDLAQDYFQVRALDEERRILQDTLADYRASLKIVKSLYDSGLASDEDLSRANTQVDTAEAQQTDLAIGRAQYEHAIAVLIGLPPSKFALPANQSLSRLPAVPLALPSELLERRPDVASAERQVAAANAGIGIARAAYFPTLSISATAGFESTSAAHLLDWPNRFWSIGPQLAESILDAGVRKAATARARAAYDQTVADYRQTVLTAFQGVEDSLSTLRFLQQEAGQQKAAVDASVQAVKLSVTRYQNGIDSYVNVITAQNAFLSSRESELQVQLRALTASVGLIKNLGGGWDASRLPSLAFTHPSRPRSDTSGNIEAPNPPVVPPAVKTPEELLQEDERDTKSKP